MGKLEDWSKKSDEDLRLEEVIELLHMGSDNALKDVYLDMTLAKQGCAVREDSPYAIMLNVVSRVVKLQGGDTEIANNIMEQFIHEEASYRWYVNVCANK